MAALKQLIVGRFWLRSQGELSHDRFVRAEAEMIAELADFFTEDVEVLTMSMEG